MALRKIVKQGDDILLKKSRKVEKFDDRLFELLDDMAETLYDAEGVGLAAVQVGVLRRAVLVDIGDEDGLIELINPEVTYSEGEQCEKEGCLSLPNVWKITSRPQKVQVKAQDRHGVWFTIEAEGLKARALCHEIDHLDGILFTTHAIAEVDDE